MSEPIIKKYFARITPLTAVLLAACSVVAPVDQVEDPKIAQLINGMDQCLASQTKSYEQLKGQEHQLDRQQQQLDALSASVAAATAGSVAVATVPVAGDEVCVQPQESSAKLMVGQLEQVWMQNLQLALPARIDTGAETASLDARNIELFERNGRRWVRFEILHPESGDAIQMERKLKRMVAIVQSNTAESERRPVIKLGVTIGHISQTAEFTLSDRSHLDYQLLIGRNILQDVMLVDVSEKNIAPYVIPISTNGDSEIVQ
jgi:hypothetical protein